MLVIVGHGPSVLSGLGSVIDSCAVVRLKRGLEKQHPPQHFGTRTDYLCARSLVYDKGEFPFWHFADEPRWLNYFARFQPKRKKPSTGLCAVFCALDRLEPTEIGLVGFDGMIDPEVVPRKWDQPFSSHWTHDNRAEAECLASLPVHIRHLHLER